MNKLSSTAKKLIAPLVVFAATGTVAAAQTGVGLNPPPISMPTVSNLTDFNSVRKNYVCVLLQWVYTVAIIFAVLYLLIAAYRYMTAAGDPEKVSKANKSLIWVLVGVAVAVVAWGLPNVVAGFFGATNNVSGFCN